MDPSCLVHWVVPVCRSTPVAEISNWHVPWFVQVPVLVHEQLTRMPDGADELLHVTTVFPTVTDPPFCSWTTSANAAELADMPSVTTRMLKHFENFIWISIIVVRLTSIQASA